MAKNKNNNTEKTTDHYKLNTKAVDRLVNANNMDIPKDKKMQDPGKKYRSDFLDRIPSPVKALFIKFWFSGSVCYFIFWGLGLYVYDSLDMIFILSVVLGMVTDILVNNILRFIEVIPSENAKWMMFPKKKYWTFFANILYSFVVLTSVVSLYEAINTIGNSIKGTENVIVLGVEPIMFGLFYLGFDLLFTSMKNLVLRIIKDAQNKVN